MNAAELNQLINSGDSVVTIPRGEYVIDSPLVIVRDNTTINAERVILKVSPAFRESAFLVVSGEKKNRLGDVLIRGLRIDCGNNAVIGIASEFTNQLTIENVNVDNSTTSGLWIGSAFDLKILGGRVTDCGAMYPAVYLGDSAFGSEAIHTAMLDNLTIERFPGTGLHIENAASIWVRSCKIHGDLTRKGSERSVRAAWIERCSRVSVRDAVLIGTQYQINVIDSVDVEISGTMSSIPALKGDS